MNPTEICKLVEQLNSELYDKADYLQENCGLYFDYSSNGYSEIIKILGYIIWSSEDDPRKWDEETDTYEPLEGYLRDAFNNYIVALCKVTL